MKETTLNHYSPVFSNRPWANRHGAIIRLRRQAGSTELLRETTGPKKWGAEKHLYSQAIEDALATVEGMVAPLYRKLLANEPLTPIERLMWSRWMLCQLSRTPSHILEFAGLEEEVLASFPAFAYSFSAAEVQEKIDLVTAGALSILESDQLIPFIMLRDWVVLRPADGEFFIKGDTPVIVRGALIHDDATVVYPLSPEHCFVAAVLGGFPPQQIQAEYRLKRGETAYYLKVIAACASCEVICHPDHCSQDLEMLVAGLMGTSSRTIKLGW